MTSLFDFISFVGAIQGVLVAIILLTRGRKERPTLFLAAYVLLFSIGLVEPWVARTLDGNFGRALMSFLSSSNYLYGPLLFLFVYFLTGGHHLTLRKYLFHFTPFTLIFILETYFTFATVDPDVHDLFLLAAFEILIVQILTYNVKAIQ